MMNHHHILLIKKNFKSPICFHNLWPKFYLRIYKNKLERYQSQFEQFCWFYSYKLF